MATAPNQHYLPRFLQNPFSSDGRKIWEFRLNKDPEEREIKYVGADDYFYSEDDPDNKETLDDKISKKEESISQNLNKIRNQSIGSKVNNQTAANIVYHLSSRTDHVRRSMESVIRSIQDESLNMVDLVMSALGLDSNKPTDLFKKIIVESGGCINRQKIKEVFFQLKKNKNIARDFSYKNIIADIEDLLIKKTREEHNKIIEDTLKDRTERLKQLEKFSWSIQAAPSEGAVLPDCAVLVTDHSGKSFPGSIVYLEEVAAVILPIAPDKLLVGARREFDMSLLAEFNKEAAKCSDAFFLASKNNDYLKGLAQDLGERSKTYLHQGVREAFKSALDERLTPSNSSKSEVL